MNEPSKKKKRLDKKSRIAKRANEESLTSGLKNIKLKQLISAAKELGTHKPSVACPEAIEKEPLNLNFIPKPIKRAKLKKKKKTKTQHTESPFVVDGTNTAETAEEAKATECMSFCLKSNEVMTLRGCFSFYAKEGIELNGFFVRTGRFFDVLCPAKSGLQLNIRNMSKETFQIQLREQRRDPLTSVMTGVKGYRFFRKLFDFENDSSCLKLSFNTAAFCSIQKEVEDLISENIVDRSCKKLRRSICICGSKNSGKSTTGLFILNRLLSENSISSVLWLDVDLGQPEFTIPGSVSVLELTEPVFGPNFCHLREPRLSLFIGSISITDALASYLKAVEKAMSFISQTFLSSIPLIVNMPGWVEIGLGLELTSNLLRIIQPSNVLQFMVSGTNVVELEPDRINASSELVPSCRSTPLKECSFALSVVHLEKPYVSVGSKNASNERQLRCLAYFYKEFTSSLSASTFLPLLDFPRKSYSFCGKVLEVAPMRGDLNPNLILMALNMSVVTFCKLEDKSNFRNPIPVGEGAFYVASAECQKRNVRIVIGHGIVTEIDKLNCVMNVITPLTEKQLDEARVISKGSIPIPQCAMLHEESVHWKFHVKDAPVEGNEFKTPPYVTKLHPREVNASGMAPNRVFSSKQSKPCKN